MFLGFFILLIRFHIIFKGRTFYSRIFKYTQTFKNLFNIKNCKTDDRVVSMEIKIILGIAIFIISFYFIISEKIPGVWASLSGGILMVFSGIITKEESMGAIADNFHILLLLISMMIIVNIISETGFFQWVALKLAIKVEVHPIKLMIVMSAITGILSAFLDNVTTVLLIIPVIIVLTKELKIDSEPYIILCIFSSSIGGAATLIGDPPNLIISTQGKLSFNEFFVYAMPLAIINLILIIAVFTFLYRKKIIITRELKIRVMNINPNASLKDIPLLKKALIVFFIVIVSFVFESFHNKGLENVALAGALYLAIRLKRNPHEIFQEIEWELIFFLIGLFILAKGIEDLNILNIFSNLMKKYSLPDSSIASIMVLWISNFSSMLIGSLPHSVIFSHVIEEISLINSNKGLWWALSYGACYGGMGTVVASACNLVGINVAKKGGVEISAKKFMKYGLIAVFISGIVSTFYLMIANYK